jgi:uracil DNA glycosylase
VRQNEPQSHAAKKNAPAHGWEGLTDAVLRAIHEFHCDLEKNQRPDGKTAGSVDKDATIARRQPGVVLLLWGNSAANKAHILMSESGQGEGLHTVIQTSHPSPLGASKTSSPFLGSGCFGRCNEALIARGHHPIDWTVD